MNHSSAQVAGLACANAGPIVRWIINVQLFVLYVSHNKKFLNFEIFKFVFKTFSKAKLIL